MYEDTEEIGKVVEYDLIVGAVVLSIEVGCTRGWLWSCCSRESHGRMGLVRLLCCVAGSRCLR